VLVEKPLAPDAAGGRRLAGLVRSTGGFLMVGQTLRWDAVVLALKRESAGVGTLRMISINQRFEPSDRPWIDTPGCGGLVLNTGVHGFDLLRWLSGGEPTHVSADVERRITRRTEDQFTALIRIEPGPVLAVVDNARSTCSRSGRIELIGEDGQVWGDHIHRTLSRVRARRLEEIGPVPQQPTVPRVLESFVRCLRDGLSPPVGVDDGVAAVEMVEAALLAARSGRRVSMEEVRGA
jgi:predicted dehydrogenase